MILVQGPTEKEQSDVQGDITYDIVDFITKTWPNVSCLWSMWDFDCMRKTTDNKSNLLDFSRLLC